MTMMMMMIKIMGTSLTTFHSVLVLFVPQLPKYGTPYRLTFGSLKRSLHLSFEDPLLSVSLSCPLAPIPIMRPDSRLRLWRYINHLLTYLYKSRF